MMLALARRALAILTHPKDPPHKVLACAMLTTTVMPKPVLRAANAKLVLMVVTSLLKQMQPLSLLSAHAQPTPMERRAVTLTRALLVVVGLVKVPQMLGLLPKLLAHAQLTIMEMPAPVIVLLARMAAPPLLLGTRIPLHLACALSTHGLHLEPMTMTYALLALLVLLPMVMESLPSLIATARLTFMELAAPLEAPALHVIMEVPLLLSQPELLAQSPLPLSRADAKPTPTQQQRTMVPHAQIALLALLLVPTKLHAVAKLVSTGKLPPVNAKVALLVLRHLLDPLHRLLACARRTTLEMPNLARALFVLVLLLVPLLAKQMQKLPLLLANALPASMEMVPHVHLARMVLLQLLDQAPSLIATARLTFMELVKLLAVHALHVLTMALLMLSHRQLPLPLLIASAQQTLMEPMPMSDALLAVQHITHLVDPHLLLDAHVLPP